MDTTNSELEKKIIGAVQESLHETIKSRLTLGYNDAPLNKLIDRVIVAHSQKIEEIVSNACASALNSNFQAEMNAAFTHKLARVLLSKFEGKIESVANDLRASPIARAKITLAIEHAVTELSKGIASK